MHPEIEKFYKTIGEISFLGKDKDPISCEYYMDISNNLSQVGELFLISEVYENRRIYYFLHDLESRWHTEEEMLHLIKLKAFL